ncbi:unnamed protein product [Ilex paraguariensis]|uniref:Calmodulin-binding domain-containing protein n=1 Tax=Ilex paraguariensis TaxID=185542 RepID=A0ABC8TM64_9AQUA
MDFESSSSKEANPPQVLTSNVSASGFPLKMVQRKVPNKPGIQANHFKSEEQLENLKPSSSKYQDGKNIGGADLKKKMKKSRSIKRSDFESLQSSNFRQQVSQCGKPPPVDFPNAPANPQKQSLTKASDMTPNYMKSTSSFDARKERSQVSLRTPQTGSDSNSPSRKNSKNLRLSSASSHKPVRPLARTSSLELARTLTKTPSFKPTRTSAKKCSSVVQCENLDVQRATCSSTLKESKSPIYLTLNPGGTESEGTSAMKVCPYTCCSLNGHHHTPLPPLKCFLSARRRMLKTQKSIKLACLSPRRSRPSGDEMKEIDIGQSTFDEKPEIQELDLNSSAISPLIQEENADFFIENHVKEREDNNDTIGEGKNSDDHATADLSVDGIMPSVGGSDETAAEHDGGQLVENFLDEPPCCDGDFEDNLNQKNDIISSEMEIAAFFPEVEIPPSIQPDELDNEATDMEWEAGQYYVPCSDEVDNLMQPNTESDLEKGSSLEFVNCMFHDEPIVESDDIVSSCFEKILADEVLQEFFDEVSMSSEAWLVNRDSESDASYADLAGDEDIQVPDNQNDGLLSPPNDAFEDSKTTEQRDGDSKSHDSVNHFIILVPAEKPIEGPEPWAVTEDKHGVSEADIEIPTMDLQLGDDKKECTISKEDAALIDHQKNESLQDDDATAFLRNQEPDHSCDFTDQNETFTASHNNIDVHQSDAGNDGNIFGNEVLDGTLLPRTEDSETNHNCLEKEFPLNDAEEGREEKEQVEAVKSFVGVQTDLWQGSSEAVHNLTSEDSDERQNGKSILPFDDKSLPVETQDQSSIQQSPSNNLVGNQNNSAENQEETEKFETSDTMDSEGQNHLGMIRIGSWENRDTDVHQMEAGSVTKFDEAKTCSIAKATTSTETTNTFFHSGSNSNQQPKTCKNPRGTTIRGSRPIEEFEDPGKFSPQEPNYLPVEQDPEAEKVDLRHQMMDERKNADEWMVDYALRQTVTKLIPARKRKVALLVEAFETVLPAPKYESHTRHTSGAFAHTRPIQACS